MKKNQSHKFILMQIALLATMLIQYSNTLAQNNSDKDSTLQLPDSIVQYIAPIDYALMMHENTSWLVKANLIYEDWYFGRTYVKFGIEKRVFRPLTINLSYNPSYTITSFENGWNFNTNVLELETRWYYRLLKRRQQKSLNFNMSDNYFAIGVERIHLKPLDGLEYPAVYSTNFYKYYLKWGLQRRLFKHGLADVGIKAGIMTGDAAIYEPSLSLNTYFDFGLGITHDKYRLDNEKLCPVLKCYEAQSYLIKTNLISLFNFQYHSRYKKLELAPTLAFEKKIGNSPFSINAELIAVLRFSGKNLDQYSKRFKLDREDYYATLEARWYYNLNKRILKGKSGNGLSASYIAAGNVYLERRYNYKFNDSWNTVYITAGWQRVFAEHLYYDIQWGMGYTYKTTASGGFNPFFKMAMGLRF
ncbi:MAG TPA: hypothetical protein P5514_11075 [Bacteroidales bacterium]|nr:hypothetical protein [Bacteroidales bacterium]HPE56141.1 hypothetical protein [Bacteroidales bacterium]HRX97479.1 hypothetical protein [Bacteroidales bacterium]